MNEQNKVEVGLPELVNMPTLVRAYGRFTPDSVLAYDTERLRQREAQLLEALAKLAEAIGELQIAEKHAEALEQKYAGCPHQNAITCACSFDHKNDVCSVHSPRLLAAESQLQSLKEENERLKRGGWIKVSERVPNEGFPVLVWSDYWSPMPFTAIRRYGEFRSEKIVSSPDRVTHWQPLPSPPEKEGNDSLTLIRHRRASSVLRTRVDLVTLKEPKK